MKRYYITIEVSGPNKYLVKLRYKRKTWAKVHENYNSLDPGPSQLLADVVRTLTHSMSDLDIRFLFKDLNSLIAPWIPTERDASGRFIPKEKRKC